MALNDDFERLFESVTLGGQSRHKLIVGIDYGTTFSGISYVTTDKSDIDDINIISTWPGEPHTTWKTPTRIAYQSENPNLQNNKWGFEVLPKLKAYSWTKLLLDKNAIAGQHDDPTLSNTSGHGMMQLPTHRDAQGVCEDFLREVYVCMSSKLRQEMSDVTYENTPMECWITLPAIWSDEAKNATLQAARRAGFGSRPGDSIFTIAEPEAAAIATLEKYSRPGALNAIKPDDHLLICDCGGGTVDLTTYTITKVQPCLEFDELCVGVGGKCGSTYIDRNLHGLLSRRFGSAFDNVPYAQKGPGSRFMASFEMVKRDFGLNEDRYIQELNPLKLDNVADSEYYENDEDLVKLTHEDMQSLFDPVVTEITKLVGQQVEEARNKKAATIDRIILVGGFGESPYLYKALKEWCREHGNISLMRPNNPQAAVVLGAALRGLEGIAPRMKQSRRHYGIVLGMQFREGRDPEYMSYFDDWNNTKRCHNRMKWLIHKGEPIFEDTFRSTKCTSHYTPGIFKSKRLDLYSSALNDAPEYLTDSRVEKVGCIVSTFSRNFDYGRSSEVRYNPALGRNIHRFTHEVRVKFGNKGDNLTCQNAIDGEVVSSAVIEFNRY